MLMMVPEGNSRVNGKVIFIDKLPVEEQTKIRKQIEKNEYFSNVRRTK